ncbi:MAG: iron permease [Isosphaeraceae bacterium]|nr:MAG: iron permease [Isosphaeraceae bacterium]
MALAVASLLIVGASLLGGLLPLASGLTHTRLQLYLSFSAGAMLGAVFFHMLPDAVEASDPGVLTWAMAGLLGLFYLERFFTFHHHEAELGPDGSGEGGTEEPGGGRAAAGLHWGVASFGLAVHTLVGGFALASAFDVGTGEAGRATALGVLVATLVHKPADSLTIVSLMLRAGVPRLWAHGANLAFASLLPLGVVVFYVSKRLVEEGAGQAGPFAAAVLSFSAGTFLCLALSDLLPELRFHKHDRLALSSTLLLGVALMWVSGWWA